MQSALFAPLTLLCYKMGEEGPEYWIYGIYLNIQYCAMNAVYIKQIVSWIIFTDLDPTCTTLILFLVSNIMIVTCNLTPIVTNW